MGNTFLFLYISFTPKNLNSIFSQDEETLNNTHLSFNKRQTQHIQNVISTPLSHTSNPFPSSTRSSKGKCCEQTTHHARNIPLLPPFPRPHRFTQPPHPHKNSLSLSLTKPT